MVRLKFLVRVIVTVNFLHVIFGYYIWYQFGNR